MFYLILITILGINIAPFFTADKIWFFWNAQGLWAQVGILLCFSFTFFEKAKFESPRNIPLGLLHLWVGLLTAVACFLIQAGGSYDVKPLLPYFNFLCLVMLYKIIVQYLSKAQIETAFTFFRYSIIATLVLCGLQFLGLAQFFKLIHPNYQGEGGQFINNLVSGFIGNGTHLSGFLAMCLPFFMYKRSRENVIAIVLLAVILCVSGQTKGDIPVSGIIIFISILFFYLFNKSRKWFWGIALLMSACLICAYFYIPQEKFGMFFHSNGRFGWWKVFWEAGKVSFLTGTGYGSVFYYGLKTDYPTHLHNEYLQFLFEGGLICFLLILNVIKEFLAIKCKDLGFAFKAVFFGFLVSSFFTYPMHLWLPASYACACYAMAVALKERENVSNKKADTRQRFKNNKTKCFPSW